MPVPSNIGELLDNWPGSGGTLIDIPATGQSAADATGITPPATTQTGSGGSILPSVTDLELAAAQAAAQIIGGPFSILASPIAQAAPAIAGSTVKNAANTLAGQLGSTFGSFAGVALLIGLGYLIFMNETRRRT